MSANITVPNYVLAIDTDQYAGNFEREMCAYCTGIVGDCGVGEEGREKFRKDFNIKNEDDFGMFDTFIMDIADDRGCLRPTSIWLTHKKYNSVAIFFRKEPTKKLIDVVKTRSKDFAKTYPQYTRFDNIMYDKETKINILGYRLINMKIVSKTKKI